MFRVWLSPKNHRKLLAQSLHKKGLQIKICKPLKLMVRQAGFEPAAYGFVVRRSIRAELLALEKTFEIYVVHKLKCYCCQCLCFLKMDARCWILDAGCSMLDDSLTIQ